MVFEERKCKLHCNGYKEGVENDKTMKFTVRNDYACCSTANTSFAASRYSLYENPMEILQGMLCQKTLNPM